MKKVYLVEDCLNAPGTIYAIFANEEDADWFSGVLDSPTCATQVVERTVWNGQPSVRGYNA